MARTMLWVVATGATVLASPLWSQIAHSPAATLADLPNTQVRHYEVTGATVTDINRSIARQRPRTWDGKPVPATTSWAVRAEFERSETGGMCRVTAARAGLTATADLPRLAPDSRTDKQLRERWQQYVGQLEQGSLATLVFVRQKIPVIEQAMLASNCDSARAVAATAIERLRAQAAILDAEREKRLARQNASLADFQPTGRRFEKTQCRNLDITGTRLGNFRICLPKREWDRMWTDTQDYMKVYQNSFSKKESF